MSTETKRFILIENSEEYRADEETCWYWDTKRPLKNSENGQPYIAVQIYKDKDPNTQVIFHDNLTILYTDQCEYYFVCQKCRYVYGHAQWSGSTRGNYDWRETSKAELENHQTQKGWCEFCDPVFGNGGWVLALR